MMIDKQLQLADGTWAPTATGDNISPNVIDLGPMGPNSSRDMGEGGELILVVTVKTAVTSAGAATVDFQLVTDSSAGMGTKSLLISTGATAKASLVAGKQFKIKLPIGGYKQYLAVNANIGTAVLTAGAFEAEIVKNFSSNSTYGSGFTV